MKKIRGFLISAGVLLMIAALAKLISANGTSRALQQPDPVLYLSYGPVFWITGLFEFCIALTCFMWIRHPVLPAALIAVLSTNLVLYRLALLWGGYHKPCSCLGTLPNALYIPPQTAEMAMKIILAYLLLGSYATLFWLWRQSKKPISSAVGVASL